MVAEGEVRSKILLWPAIIVSFLSVIIIFNLFFFYKAHSTRGGVVEESPYRASLRYEEQVQKLRASKETGWKTSYGFDGLTLQATVHDLDGNKLSLKQAELRVVSAVGRNSDITVIALAFDEECLCARASLGDRGLVGAYLFEFDAQVTRGEGQQLFFEKGLLTFHRGVLSVRRE